MCMSSPRLWVHTVFPPRRMNTVLHFVPQALENRTLDSRREMDILNALDEMRSLKVRPPAAPLALLRCQLRCQMKRPPRRACQPQQHTLVAALQPLAAAWHATTDPSPPPKKNNMKQNNKPPTPTRPPPTAPQARHEQVDTEAALAALKRSAQQGEEEVDLDAEDEEAVRWGRSWLAVTALGSMLRGEGGGGRGGAAGPEAAGDPLQAWMGMMSRGSSSGGCPLPLAARDPEMRCLLRFGS